MPSFTLAVSGSGGAGAISTGEMLLAAAARAGYFGLLRKTFSPQIRGGEAAAILRIGTEAVDTFSGHVDLLISLDWDGFGRFAGEIPLSTDSIVIQNASTPDLPDGINLPVAPIALDATSLAKSVDSSWVNMVCLGLLCRALGIEEQAVEQTVEARLRKHEQPVRDAAIRALKAGRGVDVPVPLADRLCALAAAGRGAAGERMLASGNQMVALGALEAGVRFVAAYPITPASDLLEYVARHIEGAGGQLVQAEDELAAINMVVGAGFGGVPAMTATSGPGLALMVEAMGLAVASETPVVVIDVMRGGPSTGIPTKSEQSDLNLALYGLHGDAPHLVLACNSIRDCHVTASWAVALAQELQTLAIVLSDQFLGQSLQVVEAPPQPPIAALRRADSASDGYQRYADIPDGISPMAIPATPGLMYTADGLEHRQDAVPSPVAAEHQRQLDKRLRKLEAFDFGDGWFELHGQPDGVALVICWGSVTSVALEARSKAAEQGRDFAVLSLRLLAPLQRESLQTMFGQAASLLVVEQNHGAQFLHYLRAELPGYDYASLALPGPRLMTPDDILAALGA